MKFSIAALTLLFATAQVTAHGFVKEFRIDGKVYKGNAPGAKAAKSPIRQISTINPTYGANNKAVACGPNAQWASGIADANPGSKVQFFWGSHGANKWPHNTGPIQTYMASCGNTPCSQFPALGAKWFKVSEVGRKSNGQWYQADLMNGAPAPAVTIPKNLKAGNYLIRSEIIALHLVDQGKAEFYPSCAQLRVGGNQSGVAQAKDLISLPGGYKDSNPGLIGNFFDARKAYKFPGPAVAKLTSATTIKRSVASGSANAGAVARDAKPISDDNDDDTLIQSYDLVDLPEYITPTSDESNPTESPEVREERAIPEVAAPLPDVDSLVEVRQLESGHSAARRHVPRFRRSTHGHSA